MLNEVAFLSQAQIGRISGQANTLVVSIRDPGVTVDLNPGFRDVLPLEFDDIDPLSDQLPEGTIVQPFTANHAHALEAWLEPYVKAMARYTLLVHCGAGVSRSAAIAWWVHKTFGAALQTGFPVGYLNRHVLRTLSPEILPPELPHDAPAVPAPRK
jgi:predicted protein tyrosine phosphatase